MRIQHKRLKHITQDVTIAEWESMQEQGLHRGYKIIDRSEFETSKAVDIKVERLISPVEPEPTEPDEPPIITREEIKSQLDELGIEYNTRARTEQLQELLEETLKTNE